MSESTRASWKAQGQMVGRGKVGTGKKTNKNKNKNSGRRKVKGKRLPLTIPGVFNQAKAILKKLDAVKVGNRENHEA